MNELLEKVKHDFAQGRGSESWGRYSLLFSISLEDIDEIAIRFARAVAEKSLQNAAENVQMKEIDFNSPIPGFKGKAHQIDKESITDPKNIAI